MHVNICFKRIKRIVKNIWIVECEWQVKGLTHFLHSVRKFQRFKCRQSRRCSKRRRLKKLIVPSCMRWQSEQKFSPWIPGKSMENHPISSKIREVSQKDRKINLGGVTLNPPPWVVGKCCFISSMWPINVSLPFSVKLKPFASSFGETRWTYEKIWNKIMNYKIKHKIWQLKKWLAGHSLTYRNVVMLATPGDVGHGWGCRGNSNGRAPRGCPEVDGCYSVLLEFLWRFPVRNTCFFFRLLIETCDMTLFNSTLSDPVILYLNWLWCHSRNLISTYQPAIHIRCQALPLMCCHVFGRPMESWTWKRCVPWLCRRSRCQVETPIYRGSMGLVYLPTWMVDFCGKCR